MKKAITILLMCGFGLTNAQTAKKYLVVNYSSICCGTPSNQPVVDYVKKFHKTNKCKAPEIWQETGLGREGENAIYISTDACGNRLEKKLVAGLQQTAKAQNSRRNESSSGYVHVSDETVTGQTLKSRTAGKRFGSVSRLTK